MQTATLHPALYDRLEQVLTNPFVPHAWHRLTAACKGLSAPDRETVVAQLLAATPGDGVAGFLRATFLASLTDDTQYLAEAARLVREIAPYNADRTGTFLVYAWWRFALFGGNDRARFLERLRIAAFPEILSMMGAQLDAAASERPAPREITGISKVAVVVPLLSTLEHAPTALALHHAQLLSEQGLTVKIFAPQELQMPEMRQFVGGGENFTFNPPPDPNNWKQFTRDRTEIFLANNQLSLMTRHRNILRRIGEFDPDLIFFTGFFSPLLFPLHAARPVVGLSIHTIPPVGPVDVWLAADKTKLETPDQSWSPHIPSPQAVHYPYRIRLRPEGRPLTRRELGLDADATVLVSVGDNLIADITGEWAEQMLAFLADNRNVQLLLVGGTGELPAVLKDRAPAQIRSLAHHSGIREICRCCDIFVNPPRMGGGFSVATAMADGLPVLAYTGADGGDKIAEYAVKDHAAYFARLAQLVADPALRKQEGAAMQALFRDTLDLDAAAPALMDACQTALESYRQRVTAR